MKLVILYRPDSEFSRITETFIGDYTSRYSSISPEVINIDTRQGSATAEVYDIVQYPAILVIRDDGSLSKSWQGPKLPLIDEVASYTNL
jgi:hypothetical protein